MPKQMISILVVDDDQSIGPLLGDILVYLGHAVCAIVTSEDAAVAAAVSHRPDLILMDAGLRPGNGIDAMDRIVALIGPVPHVFISGDLKSIGIRVPRAIALQKPFQIDQIETAIHQAMDQVDNISGHHR
ncbi:response regulator [Acidiphilium sp.]|uniref:response regulator n=1 Tax=Acidiphilium sp. TaxID=527 RepID=UPI003D047542